MTDILWLVVLALAALTGWAFIRLREIWRRAKAAEGHIRFPSDARRDNYGE